MGLLPCILDTCVTCCYPEYVFTVAWFGVKILQYTFKDISYLINTI